MAKKGEVKKMTLRQRLRADAAEKLHKIGQTMLQAGRRAMEEEDTEINAFDVMRLISGSQNKTLREKLITDLANEAEAKLEALYNKQMELIDGD